MNRFGSEVKAWWPRPTTRRDRIVGTIFGGLGAMIVDVATRLLVGPLPLPVSEVLGWVTLSSVVGVLIGLCIPKFTILLSYPFVRLFGVVLDGL